MTSEEKMACFYSVTYLVAYTFFQKPALFGKFD